MGEQPGEKRSEGKGFSDFDVHVIGHLVSWPRFHLESLAREFGINPRGLGQHDLAEAIHTEENHP